jgi:hypothetical protein
MKTPKPKGGALKSNKAPFKPMPPAAFQMPAGRKAIPKGKTATAGTATQRVPTRYK